MEPERQVVDIDAAIDEGRVRRYQVLVFCLCGGAIMFDGFDNQTIGILAPSIATNFHVNVSHFGLVFSGGLFGFMIGSLALGALADRAGRRWIVIGALLMFSCFTFLATTATTLRQLSVLWFVDGLGLGGVFPNAIALATEFAPRRLEAKVAGWVVTGMPAGAILGGILSTLLLPIGGWRAVLYVGSVLPLLLAVVLIFWLPESARFLITARNDTEGVKRIMARISPKLEIGKVDLFRSRHEAGRGVPVGQLFTEGRAIDTLLFWLAFFGNLLILYFVLTWFPAMLHGAGMPVSTAIIATTLFSVGGVIGTATAGYLMGSIGARAAPIAQLAISALLTGIFADQHTVLWVVWTMATALGIAVQGAQAGLNALAADYYPTGVRATGLGWALGMGRIGSIVGPLLGELMLSLHWDLEVIFTAGMVPAILAALALGAIAHRRRHASARAVESFQSN